MWYLVLSERPQVAEQFAHGVHSVKTIGCGQNTGRSPFPAQKPVSVWLKSFPVGLTGWSCSSSSRLKSSWQVNPPFLPGLQRRLRLRWPADIIEIVLKQRS
jgi:hypothetical protein